MHVTGRLRDGVWELKGGLGGLEVVRKPALENERHRNFSALPPRDQD